MGETSHAYELGDNTVRMSILSKPISDSVQPLSKFQGHFLQK